MFITQDQDELYIIKNAGIAVLVPFIFTARGLDWLLRRLKRWRVQNSQKRRQARRRPFRPIKQQPIQLAEHPSIVAANIAADLIH